MKSKGWKPSLWISTWKRTAMTLKNMNWKTLIPKLALVAFALSAPAALSQEEILIITGKRMDKTVFYQISPNARELDFSDNRLTSLTLPRFNGFVGIGSFRQSIDFSHFTGWLEVESVGS